MAPPPLIAPTASAKPPKRGRGWMFFALFLLLLLAISMMFNVGSFFSSLAHGRGGRPYARVVGPRLDEVLKEDNDASDKIAVVEVSGLIANAVVDQGGFNMVEIIRAQLKRAEQDDRVKAVLLKVDSPGGEVMAADQIHHEISDFQRRSRKPIIASMGSLAASGGYYVSAPCRWILANELTITGSIGVIMNSFNYRHLMDKVGVLPETYKSGRFKDMLSGSREPDKITPEERAMIQSLIDETFSRFKTVVQEGRGQANQKNKDSKQKGRTLTSDWEDYADGRILSGTEAYKLGFVDELGTFEDAIKRAEQIAGISNANVVEYQQRYELSDLFRLFGKSESSSIKIELGLDMPKLQAGRMYFLSPTLLH
jgi:protease IV